MRLGKRVRVSGIEFVFTMTTATPRFAFVVPVGVNKKATARNRMKRLLREAVHHLLPEMRHGVDGVFFVRGKIPETEGEVEKIVKTIIMKIWSNT